MVAGKAARDLRREQRSRRAALRTAFDFFKATPQASSLSAKDAKSLFDNLGRAEKQQHATLAAKAAYSHVLQSLVDSFQDALDLTDFQVGAL